MSTVYLQDHGQDCIIVDDWIVFRSSKQIALLVKVSKRLASFESCLILVYFTFEQWLFSVIKTKRRGTNELTDVCGNKRLREFVFG
jgi:hypothetical protein